MRSESTPKEDLVDLSPVKPKYWHNYAVAPYYVARPQVGQIKGYYTFFRPRHIDMYRIWNEVCRKTKQGQFGYYCGFEGEMISIHFSDPNDNEVKERIEKWFSQFKVNDFEFRTKAKE